MPLGFTAPLEIRSIDSDSGGSNRSKKSEASVRKQQMPIKPGGGQPLPPSIHQFPDLMTANGMGNNSSPNHNQNYRSNPPPQGKPNEFFVDVM